MAQTALIFVHGRSQEFKDPDVLRRDWVGGLNAGLTRSGQPLVEEKSVLFPFYGNALYQKTADLARSGSRVELEQLPADINEPGPLHPEMPEEVGTVERELLADMVVKAGVAETAAEEGLFQDIGQKLLGWGPARSALGWLADRTRLDQEIIAGYLKDVAVYLKVAREPILKIVRDSIPTTGPLVIVSHSLGTVVARDLLDDKAIRDRTRFWVTAGSPLGLEAVQKNLQTPGHVNPGVEWLSTFDVHDVVALGHPFRPSWGNPLVDVEVSNGNDPHSITMYLSHPAVAAPIGTAMKAG